MILRRKYINKIDDATRRAPVVSLLGPRQCGKTTLARLFGDKHEVTYFDLESIPDQRRLQNPELMLGSLKGLVILDEIQIMPELFSVLRVLVDRPGNQARFLILGSASPHIIKNVSETLAGRAEFIELSGFNIEETGKESQEKLWLRGGSPLPFSPDQTRTAWPGGKISSEPFWSGTYRNWVFLSRPKPCDVFGQCSPTTTDKP